MSSTQAMEPGDVTVFKWDPPLSYQFFKNILPDMSITRCEGCNRVFHTDDYELQLLQKGHCPFCRTPAHFLSAGTGGGSTAAGMEAIMKTPSLAKNSSKVA